MPKSKSPLSHETEPPNPIAPSKNQLERESKIEPYNWDPGWGGGMKHKKLKTYIVDQQKKKNRNT